MKNKKKIIITISVMLLITLTILIGLNKKEIKLDEVKLKNTLSYDSKNLSIMIYNNDKSEYEKYTGEGFPDRTQYVYNTTDSGCLNTNGDKIANALNYDAINRKVTLTTRETVHCYMYFSSGKTLTLEKGEGIDKIYYKVNEETEYSETNETVSVAVLPGNTYSYYAEASEGYTIASCYDNNTHLCSGTMPNENQTIVVNNTTPNKYTLTIPYSAGVKEIKYKINGATDWSTQTINATIDGNATISNVDYNSTYEYYATKINNFATLSNCYDDNTHKCSGTMNNINGVTATKINTTFITLANYVISISNDTGSNGVMIKTHDITVQTGNNATTDYRYVGNGECSYNNGNYIGGLLNGICPILYNYTSRKKDSGYTQNYTYRLNCPNSTSSYSYNCTATFEGTKISEGPNNYVCLGNLLANGQCIDENHLYRIIGVMPTQTSKSGGYENRVKLIKATEYLDNDKVSSTYTPSGYGYYWTGQKENGSEKYTSYTGASTRLENWEESTLNRKILNQTFYNSLDTKYQNMIGNSVWYLGGFYQPNDYKFEYGYTSERSDNVIGTNPLYAERRIGLMYPSDYGFASPCVNKEMSSHNLSNMPECVTKNWIFINEMRQWTTTPRTNSSFNMADFIGESGGINMGESFYYSAMVRPSFYLNSSVKVVSGTGSINSPYTISS